MQRRRWCPILAGTVLLLAGCGVTRSGPEPEGPAVPSTTAPKALTGAEVLGRLRGSVALVSTGFATGSAVLVDGGYLVTNAHVVDPFDVVDVTFEGDDPILDVEVVGVDLTADIALLGPVETDHRPASLVDPAELDDGTDLYLVGYPGDQEGDQEATLARGVLSRHRTAKGFGLEYLQSDAAIAGGQSGGALVDARGEVVGISGLSDDDGFALSLSAADVLDSVDRIEAGEGSDWSPAPDVVVDRTVRFDSDVRQPKVLFFGGARRSASVTVHVEGPAPAVAQFDPGFYPIAANQAALDLGPGTGVWSMADDVDGATDADADGRSWTFEVEPGYDTLLVVGSASSKPGRLVVTTDEPFAVVDLLPEPRPLEPGDEAKGSVGYLDTFDTYALDLAAGEEVDLSVRAASGDMAYSVVAPGEDYWSAEEVDDEGGGLLGLDAEGTYEADEAGTYLLYVYQVDDAPTDYVVTTS